MLLCCKNLPVLLWGPFLWGPLFGRTCWTCLNPPLSTCKIQRSRTLANNDSTTCFMCGQNGIAKKTCSIEQFHGVVDLANSLPVSRELPVGVERYFIVTRRRWRHARSTGVEPRRHERRHWRAAGHRRLNDHTRTFTTVTLQVPTAHLRHVTLKSTQCRYLDFPRWAESGFLKFSFTFHISRLPDCPSVTVLWSIVISWKSTNNFFIYPVHKQTARKKQTVVKTVLPAKNGGSNC